jgi:hypothetical protein
MSHMVDCQIPITRERLPYLQMALDRVWFDWVGRHRVLEAVHLSELARIASRFTVYAEHDRRIR